MNFRGWKVPSWIDLGQVYAGIMTTFENNDFDDTKLTWGTADGREIKFCDMTDEHVHNAITFHLDKLERGVYFSGSNNCTNAFGTAMLMYAYRRHRIHKGIWTMRPEDDIVYQREQAYKNDNETIQA